MRTNTHSLCCNVDAPVGHNLRCSRLEATTLSFYMLSLGRPTEHFKHLRQPVRLHHARTPMTSTINGACLLSGSLPYIYADSLVPNCECRPGNLPSVMARRVYPPESSPVPFRIKIMISLNLQHSKVIPASTYTYRCISHSCSIFRIYLHFRM